MKVLFAVNNDNVSEAIAKKYERDYKDILSYKNVYYFNAIIRELQKDKTYNRVIISEDLEPFANNNYEMIDKFLLEKYTNISNETKMGDNEKIEVILLCADRRKKADEMLIKLYNLEIYSAIIGQDRSIEEVCKLIYNPRDKNIAKQYYEVPVSDLSGQDDGENNVSEAEVENILAHYKRLGKNEDKYVDSFNNIISQYTDTQLKIIIRYLPIHVKAVLEERSPKYQQLVTTGGLPGQNANFAEKANKYKQKAPKKSFWKSKNNNYDDDDESDDDEAIIDREFTKPKMSQPIVIPSDMNTENVQKVSGPNLQRENYNNVEINRQENYNSPSAPAPTPQVNQEFEQRTTPPAPTPQVNQEFEQRTTPPAPTPQVNQEFEQRTTPVAQTNTTDAEQKPMLQQIEKPEIHMQDVSVPDVTLNNQNANAQKVEDPTDTELDIFSQSTTTQNTTPIQEIGEDLFDGLLDVESTENEGNNKSNDSTENQNTEPVKHGRGRPRTKPIVEVDPNVPKRGRGRPRTKPIVEVDPNLPKRGRGRPRKQQPEEIEGQIQEIVTKQNDSVQETTTQMNQISEMNNTAKQETDLFSISEEMQPINNETTQQTVVTDETVKQDQIQTNQNNKELVNNNIETQNAEVDLFNMEEKEPVKEELPVDLFETEEKLTSEPEFTSMQTAIPENLNNVNTNGSEEDKESIMNIKQEETTYKPEEENIDLYNNSNDFDNSVNLFEENNDITTTNRNSGYSSLNTLLTADKKIVAFVGTTKNGTSFVVNNTAEMLSSMGIPTAILDMTKSKNAYYIYTNNEEELRKISAKCMKNLENGVAEGIKITKTLTVYTEIPGETENYNFDKVLSTLVQNYSAVLIDTDFDTPLEIFEKVQELYLVQSMDVLTIQPLTAFLRDLKSKNILKPEKLRIVINKAQKIRSLNVKTLIGGMSCYNAPNMSYMTELFDKDNIRYCEIPFETQNYIKYLESLVICEVTLNGYTKSLLNSLKELANIVYPLVGKQSYSPMNGNNKKDPFSKQMSSTLNKMKNNGF